jgi:hypothetical protein
LLRGNRRAARRPSRAQHPTRARRGMRAISKLKLASRHGEIARQERNLRCSGMLVFALLLTADAVVEARLRRRCSYASRARRKAAPACWIHSTAARCAALATAPDATTTMAGLVRYARSGTRCACCRHGPRLWWAWLRLAWARRLACALQRIMRRPAQLRGVPRARSVWAHSRESTRHRRPSAALFG